MPAKGMRQVDVNPGLVFKFTTLKASGFAVPPPRPAIRLNDSSCHGYKAHRYLFRQSARGWIHPEQVGFAYTEIVEQTASGVRRADEQQVVRDGDRCCLGQKPPARAADTPERGDGVAAARDT